MKCWKCGNELTTGDKSNSLMCRTCEEKQNTSCSCSAKSVYDAATAFWRASGVAAVAYGAPGLPGPSSESREWDEERAMLEGAIYTLQEAHGHLYKSNSLMCRNCEEKQTNTEALCCSECGWTNVGLVNLGEPEQPRMVCMGCCKRAIEALDACRSILIPKVAIHPE